jgi:PAS domain S-box-containing protein
LADDNADMRDYVRRLLADDYEVVAVADGAAALEAAVERRPDLILTDVMMPRLDGFELLGRLRENPRTASIPVIMVSARAGEEARVEGLAAGADDYMIKPFSAKELVARVSGTLAVAGARREALGREARLRAETATVLDSITDGFVALDQTFRCTRANPQAERLLGASRSELTGRTLWEAFPEMRGTEIEVTLQHVMAERAPRKIETWFAPWSRWFELDVYPTADDGLAVYFRDVSDRKAALEALRDADRRKDEFLALLAHELRNPLAPLRNGLEVLRLAGADGHAAADARAMMERQLFHLVRLVDDLLDISRITRNKLELRRERIVLADAVSTALETARPAIEAAGHELTVRLPPEPIVLDADLTRIAQVLSNLLINSAKYTAPRGRIALVAERDDGEVRIVVHDTGVGIPRSALPSIFDMFSQVDRTSGTSGGLGIGLAIVKGLVEMHEGHVDAHSDGPGTGSTFVVHLPLPADVAARASSIDATARAQTAGRSLRVLVVDDNVDSAESMRMMLSLLGYEARTAHDGVSAFTVAESFRPEVVFMDIGMPRQNGLEATQRIRREPWGHSIVIIAVTGWGQESDRLSSKEAGCDGHLIKPVDPASLETLLATYAASGTIAAPEQS